MAQQDIYNQDGKISSSVRNKLSNASLQKSSGASLLKQSTYGVDNNDTDKDNNDVLTSLTQQIAQDSKNNAHKGQANATVGDKITGTLVELGYNIVNPFLKLGEGVVDAHAILFNAQDFVKTDWTNTFLQWVDDSTNNKLSKSMKNSYTYDLSDVEFLGTTLDETIRGVEQGIGSSLGGAALSSIPYVGAVLYGMGAGGMSLEQAMNEDPNNEQSSIASKVGYGILSGATEQLIEWGSSKLQGTLFKDKGVTTENFGILKSKGKNLRDTMVDLFIDAGFEGAEEVVSDCLDPLYQSVYNGKSVADNYVEDWSIEGLTSSFVVGALSGLVMGSSSEALQRTMYSSDGLKAMELINKSVENEMNAKKEFNKVAQSGTTDMVEAVKNYQSKIATSQQMMEKAGELIKGLKPFYQQQLQRKNINFENVNENSESLKQVSSATAQQINYDNSIKPIVENINKIRGNGKELSVRFVNELNEFNGKIVNNTIYLSNNPQKAYRQILSHELSHTLENTNSEYNVIAKQIYDKAMKEEKYQDFAKLYTDKDANVENEVVAEYIADNFFTSYKDIADVFKTKNAKEKLVDLLKGLRKQTGDAKLKQQYLNLIQKLINTKVIEETASRTLSKDQLRNRKSINEYLKSKTEEYKIEKDLQIKVEEYAKISGGDVEFSRKEAPMIFANQLIYNKKYNVLDQKTLNKAIEDCDTMVKMMSQYDVILPKDEIGKNVMSNGSYGRTIENTTICVRTLSYNYFVDEVAKKLDRPLTQEESFLASQMLYDIAVDPQCLYCYVSLDRKAYNEYLLRYITDRDAILEKWNKSNKTTTEYNKLYKEWLRGRTDNKVTKSNFKMFIEYNDNGTPLINNSDIKTANTREDVAKKSEEYARQINSIQAYAQSASWQKKQLDYRAYGGDILKIKDQMVKTLNKHYGLRFYSFSDYSGAFIVENMQQITDASLKGFKGLAYTKDVDFAKIFAPTGMNINISVFVKQNSKGEFFIDERQSAKLEEAKKLREQYGNVGIVAVATSDEGVKWALKQKFTDVVIPFHIVKTGAEISEFYKWSKYNGSQNDKDYSESKTGKARNVLPSEHQNDYKTYKKVLGDREARFSQFEKLIGSELTEQEYMKLVNETRVAEKDTPKLQPIFDLESAKESFKKFKDKGGYFGGWWNEGTVIEEKIDQVANDILTGKRANEVDYGRQDIDTKEIMDMRKVVRTHGVDEKYSKQELSIYGQDNFLSTEEKLNRLVETKYKEESTINQITFDQKASEVATKIANAINTKNDRTAIRNLVTIQVDSIRLDGLTLEEAYDLNNKVDVDGVLVPLSDTFKNYRKQIIEELTDLYIKQYGTKQSVKQLTNKAIYWFKDKIHSISLNNNRVRKIIKNVVNIRQAFKKIYDGKIYGSNRLESAFQSISGQIAKLSFNNTTSKITQDGRAIATSLVDIFNKNRAVIETLKELYKEEIGGQVSYKEYDDKMRRLNLIKDYLADQIQKYEVIQGKVHIDGLDYDTKLEFPEGHKYEELSGLTEAEMALEVFKVAYDSLRGNQKTFDYIKDGKTETRFVKDEVKTELDIQQEYVRKVGKNKILRGIKNFTQDVLDSDAYFNVLAYSNKDSFFNYITERLRAGRDTSYGYYYQIFDPVQKVLENNKNIAKDLKKTKVQYLGKEISLGELIALRLMSETDNAPSHLFGKGIEFSRDVGQATKIDGQQLIDKYVNEMDKQILKNKPKAEEKAQIYENAILQLQSDLDSMIDSKYDEFMFAIREMYKNSTEVYKDASLKINGAYYGTKRVYYPIMSSIYKSIQSFANGTMDVGGFVSNELNPSFTKKANNNATNRIIVNDVLDTALFFADKLSNYAGVTYEVNQLNKVLLYKYNGDTTLSKYIQENVDDKFEKRYNSLVKAMQGISNRESSSFSTIVNYFKNINARYNLGANTKTILSQFLSLPMANIYVSNGNITKGLFNHSKSAMEKIGGISFDDLAKIDAYTRKRYENNNILQADSLIENIADNPITKTMMYPIQWMDRNTISTIWYACQYQSLDENGKVDIKKAIELYHKAVELTQPQYDALNNGYITRDSSEVMRLLIQFSSVTRKYFSRIFEGAYNLYTSKKLYGKDSVEYKQAKQHYVRVIGDFTVATFLIVALTSLLKALKGDYKDDEADEIIKDIATNFGSNIFSLLPIVKDVYNVAISGYDMEIGVLSMMSDSINSFKNNIPKLFDNNSTRNERTSATWSLIQEISKFCGVPIKNIYNNFQYLFGIIDETTGSQIRVESGLIFYNTGNSTLTELMKVAKSKGKDSQIGGILDSKFYNYINGERLTDTQKKELTRLYKLGVLDIPSATPSKITYTDSFGNEVEVELNKAQRQKFQDVYKLANEGFEQMLNSRYYNSLTDGEKAKAIAKLYDTYYELAKQNVLEKQSTNRLARLSRYINVSKYCIYLSKISSMVSTDSVSRATQVQNYINRINMSRKEKYLLYYLSGYSREEYKEEILDYLISKGMPRKKAKEFLGIE